MPGNGQNRRDSVTGVTDVSSIDISFGGRWDRHLSVDLAGRLSSECDDARAHELSSSEPCTPPRGAEEALIQSVSHAVAKELRWWNVVDIKMCKPKSALVYSQTIPTNNNNSGIPDAARSDTMQEFSDTTAQSFLLCSSAG